MVNAPQLLAIIGALACSVSAQDHFKEFEEVPAPEVSDILSVEFSTVLDPRLQNVFPPGTTAHADNLRRAAADTADEAIYYVSSDNYTALMGAAAGMGCVVGLVAYSRKMSKNALKRAADQIYSPHRVARRNTWPMSPARLV